MQTDLIGDSTLRERAEKLHDLILNRFWLEDEAGGYFALGSDRDEAGNLRLLNVRASNMGHLLNSRILEGDNPQLKHIRTELVETLFSPTLLSKRGVRTLASQENRYQPRSYHNGSVWPWDTTWISLGLLRHGYIKEAQDLWRRVLNTIAETKCFPEFVAGKDDEPPMPSRIIRVHDLMYDFDHSVEQPPQQIQAWTVASVVAIEHLMRDSKS